MDTSQDTKQGTTQGTKQGATQDTRRHMGRPGGRGNARRRRARSVPAAAVLALAAAGCGGGSSGEHVEVGLTVSTLNNPFFVEMKKGAEAEAKARGAELTVQDAQNDPSQQADQIQNFTSKNVRAVIVNPVDTDAAAPAVKAADNAGVPVVAADRTVAGGHVKTAVASDNVAGGTMAAQRLGSRLHGKGSILVLRGQPGTSASRERGKGFARGLRKYPGIHVAARQAADFDRSKALDVTTNLLQSHPHVDAVFAENDEMALGAVKALGGRAGRQVDVVGFDGTPDALKAVKKGTMSATIAQQPEQLGRMAVRNAIKAAKKKRVPGTVQVPVKPVDKGNADRFR